MPRDDELHDAAVRFPEALLALLGERPTCLYTASSLELKRSPRRIDVVLTPRDPDAPVWLVEVQRRRDVWAELGLLKKVVDFCTQTRRLGRVRAAIVYARADLARGVHPPRIGGDRCVVSLDIRRLVLDATPHTPLERRGGSALVLLPLLGDVARVRRRARGWLARIEREVPPEGLPVALDLFVRFLADRLSKIDLDELLGREGPMRDTVTGQKLLEEGRKKGHRQGHRQGRRRGEQTLLERQLVARFGAIPPEVQARLDGATAPELEAWAVRLLDAASLDDVFVETQRPRGRSPRARRARRAGGGRS